MIRHWFCSRAGGFHRLPRLGAQPLPAGRAAHCDYVQRHAIELTVRPRVLAALREHFPIGRLGFAPTMQCQCANWRKLSETSLMQLAEIRVSEKGLPTTFVPGRNLIFFTYAAAIAYRCAIPVPVGGMCETD
jgi:7-cyano-7-deazaguanine synthase